MRTRSNHVAPAARAVRQVLLVSLVVAGSFGLTACDPAVPAAGTVPISSAPAAQGCITSVGATNKMVVTGCGGDITYNVSVPARCLTHACGLIMDVHGWTMSGDIQEANTQLAALGRAENYIVVQPTAPGAPPSWNSSHYPLVSDFMTLAMQVWRVDTRRVHFTGFSQGGGMTFWMRCNRASILASVAPAALSGTACAQSPVVPTLYIQGHNDIFISEAAITNTVNSFISTYSLPAGQVIVDVPGDRVYTHYQSASGAVFDTYIHNHSSNGVNGHCVMGSPSAAEPYGCDQATPLSHGQAAMAFFKAHPKTT